LMTIIIKRRKREDSLRNKNCKVIRDQLSDYRQAINKICS
jgi:hypothetical protein